jgi:hypothetical protein
MQSKAFGAFLSAALAGCATPPSEPPSSVFPQRSDDFVSAAGTPFLLVLKVPACVAVAVLTGPVVAASALVDNDGGRETRHAARNTLRQTCGPPYTIAP